MKKDIEWLKKEFDDLFNGKSILTVGRSVVDEILNQLDEPEVLSQEWIDEHKIRVDNWNKVVLIDDLKKILVPKQEITEEQAWEKISQYYPVKQAGLKNAFEHFYYGGFMTDVVAKKPVIPKFVAEWIEHNKESGDIHTATNLNSIHTEIHFKEIYKNQSVELQEIIARAWLDGYTVEEEQKYEVRCKGELLLTYYTNIGEVVSMNRWDNHLSKKAGRDWKLRHELTEQEIKDYDPRYWAFAKPVEEMEE